MNNQKETATIARGVPLELAGRWLLNSGIQNRSSDPKLYGGMHAWFDLDTETFSFLYPEITAYAISTLLFLHDLGREARYLVRAKEAAQWLMGIACHGNPWVCNRVLSAKEDKRYFDSWTFTLDNWIVVYGLCTLFEATKETVYLNKAIEIADFLIRFVQKKDGLFHPAFNIEKKQPESTNDKWSRQSGAFHAKAVFALLKLNKLTREDRFFEAAAQLVQSVLTLQKSDGRFITHDGTQSTLLHPHLYALEGLAYFGFAQNDSNCINAVQKGIEWILRYQNEDGSIYCLFERNGFCPCIRVDVLAQTLRMASLLLLNARALHLRPHLVKLRDCLVGYQLPSGPQQGGFLYGQEENGVSHRHVNSWVTMFAVQALWLYEACFNGDSSYRWDFFI